MNTKSHPRGIQYPVGFWNDMVLALSVLFSFTLLLGSHGLFEIFQTWWKCCTSLEEDRSLFPVLEKEKSHHILENQFQILQQPKFSHDLFGDVSETKLIMHGLARLLLAARARDLHLATVSSLLLLFLILCIMNLGKASFFSITTA